VVAAEKEVPVSHPDQREAARLRRERLIERLNAKEAELSGSRTEDSGLPEQEFELEKERQRNLSRRGFPYIFGGPSA
jgi:hypothetical protein